MRVEIGCSISDMVDYMEVALKEMQRLEEFRDMSRN